MSMLSSFFSRVTGTKLSSVTSAVASMVPVVGPALSTIVGPKPSIMPGLAPSISYTPRVANIMPTLGRTMGGTQMSLATGMGGIDWSKVLQGAGGVISSIGGARPGAGSYLAAPVGLLGGRRKRGRGFSSRDIRQTRRMFKLVKEFNAMSPRRSGGGSRRCR